MFPVMCDADARRQTATERVDMAVTVQWLGHASFRIGDGRSVVYIDPWKLSESPHDAAMVLVSHSHYDHYSAADIAKVAGPHTKIVGPSDVASKQSNADLLEPGQTLEAGGVKVTGVAAYNPDKQFHTKASNWLGFVITIEAVRIYYAGDTDLTDEMKALGDIDVALLPVGGTYTMGAEQAAAAVERIKPEKAIPYHWGDIVGKRSDAERFAELAACEVAVLNPGDSIEAPG